MTIYRAKPPFGSKINAAHPLGRNMVAAWLMNEAGGRTVYDSVGQNHGETMNSPLPNRKNGEYGKHLNFTNSADCRIRITNPTPALRDLQTSMTIATVVKYRSYTGYETYFSQFDGLVRRPKLLRGYYGVPHFYLSTDGWYQGWSFWYTLPLNVWTPLWVTVSGTPYPGLPVITMGTPKSLRTIVGDATSSNPTSTTNIYLGGTADYGSQEFDGEIACTYVWNEAKPTATMLKWADDPFCMFRKKSVWSAPSGAAFLPQRRNLHSRIGSRSVQ